jgi:hypothetical protein
VGFDVFNQPATELESAAKASDLAAIEEKLHEIHRLAARIAPDEELTPAAAVEVATSFKPIG